MPARPRQLHDYMGISLAAGHPRWGRFSHADYIASAMEASPSQKCTAAERDPPEPSPSCIGPDGGWGHAASGMPHGPLVFVGL